MIGNPDAATPEKGERLFSAISDHLATILLNPGLWDVPWQADPPVD